MEHIQLSTRSPERRTLVDLTIASVSFGDWPLLELNRELCERMNPGLAARWRIVRNLPVQAEDAGARDDPEGGLELLEGDILGEDLRRLGKHRSYHHALGLNRATGPVSTRYLALMDADCFVVRPHWLEHVLDHMRACGLACFGVPYHPRSFAKIRYFPCAVFMIVDTEQVPVDELDWTPEARAARPSDGHGPLDRRLQTWIEASEMPWRLRAEESEDTGIRLYTHLRAQGLRSDTVVPVYSAAHAPKKLRTPRQLVLEHLLPDRYCILPKRRDGMTDRGFGHAGLEDFSAQGCEEYMWRDEPFALHLRGGPAALRSDLGAIRAALERFPSP
jgi:hypothetical protein